MLSMMNWWSRKTKRKNHTPHVIPDSDQTLLNYMGLCCTLVMQWINLKSTATVMDNLNQKEMSGI
jgi:hypothetical protein